MLIGELAHAAGLPSQTIRFYERKGLLPAAERGANGYRNYDESTLPRLRFVQSAQAAGLTLAEIGTVIDLRGDGNVPCSHVTTLIERKLIEVRARIKDLALLESELKVLIERSHRLDPDDCTDADVCNILSAVEG
ncbi:heavy metal-responsive transcriptional regulator [Nocardioides sp.]|uniref:heavy metal-responsive transcriptional regulator n=1 Tax=Nocardioides sp. TaxID=35761 RepID=UPI002B6B9FB2|nr:heavy metal-responsive transcriptional regulator [Nocardioides sp.]HXH78739.1 heavy metal-responsive transcriptional regulator [Nocardioides sp.]